MTSNPNNVKEMDRVLIWHPAEPVVLRPSMRFKLHYTILSKLFDYADVLAGEQEMLSGRLSEW